MTLSVRRQDARLGSDARRVLVRPFAGSSPVHARHILARVLAVPDAEVPGLVEQVLAEFMERHYTVRELLLRRFEEVSVWLECDPDLPEDRKLLIGSYFVSEYSLESAALFNPSIVAHPDQTELPNGWLRFILSLRAVGEGHVSSITFRTGTVDETGQVTIDPASRYVTEPTRIPNASYDKKLFARKLAELTLTGEFARGVLGHLGDHFTLGELEESIGLERRRGRDRNQPGDDDPAMASKILALAQSNFEVHFRPNQPLSERVIFPATPSQRNGIEDARFVRFREGDEEWRYYATYTAYDGHMILPQLVETPDFIKFRFITLNGPAVQNKGMALFPRPVGGCYAMLSRQDNENILLMRSEHMHFWHEAQVIARPRFPWELVQLGNCGSPIETEAGWLVLSHGVGPMRKYCMGAFLLDLEEPWKVIGRLAEPLLSPTQEEREGYVPNVVYSCGGLLHGDQLILPYAMSDVATKFASVKLKDVLEAMS